MTLDDAGLALLKIAEDLGSTRVSGNAFFVGAKTLLANAGLSQAWADIEAHRWSHLVDVGITQGARIIASIDPPLAPIAPLAAAIVIYARHHPAGTLSETMSRADGQGGAPSTWNVAV